MTELVQEQVLNSKLAVGVELAAAVHRGYNHRAAGLFELEYYFQNSTDLADRLHPPAGSDHLWAEGLAGYLHRAFDFAPSFYPKFLVNVLAEVLLTLKKMC